jgi:proteic killer suppression protein
VDTQRRRAATVGGRSPLPWYDADAVKKFRMRMQFIRGAANKNDLRAQKSFHFEKLKGNRKHEYSIRLNKKFRLILQIEKADTGNVIVVTGIEDYH